MRLVVLLCCLIFVAPGIAHSADDLDREFDACKAKMVASPEYRALQDKMGVHARRAMMSSIEKATPQEVAQIQTLRKDYVLPCRRIQRELVRRHHPFMVPILDAGFAKSDANYARLTTYQVTWGQFIRVGEALEADLLVQFHRAQTMPEVEPAGSPSRR